MMTVPAFDWLSTTATTFGLVGLAEMGDKTQLVCMTLAARQPGLPVLVGAVLAFVVLNLLAVLFGAALAVWVPEALIAAIVALLFGVFGLLALRDSGNDEDDGEISTQSGRGALLSALLLIFVAELGDKTQIAVAGLASTQPPVPVWVGATLALALTSALGVLAGRTLLQRLPLRWLHLASGLFFLLLAVLAGWRAASLVLA
jgi:putative Ca2+/H+ antiporter (TMEM165/GDT1 family)